MHTRQNLAVSLVLAISMVGISYGVGGDMGAGTEPLTDGSAAYPHLIEDLADFDVFADQANAATYWSSGVYTKLTCDPNLTGRPYTTAVIAPDGSSYFRGIFDGDGHIVSNLTIDTADANNDYLGLFGKISGSSAEVKNLGIENINITGGADSDYLGGLCGDNHQGTITNCYATGSVIGQFDSNCLGGLCGKNNEGTINDCYASGSVTGGGNSSSLGGLCGYNRNGTISNCHATGAVTGDEYLGGLCGINSGGPITNCFWDVETGGPYNGIGTPKTTAQMQTQSTFTDDGWDFTDESANGTSEVWQMPTGGGYPVLSSFNGYTPVLLSGNGTEANPYLISNAAQLGAMYYYNSNACFRLQSDIDLIGIQWSTAIVPAFGGCFDGNGYVIYNLNIEGGGYLGLFGKISGSSTQVKNLGIENLNITGGTNSVKLGGLCGLNYGTITNCYAVGSVTGNNHLGGLCGKNYYGTITNCYAAGSVTGGVYSYYLGGLCGWNDEGTITNCYAAGSVNGGTCSGYLGGLCGENDEGTITNCYATGSVTGNNYLGGLCGKNYGTITNCYATDSVTGDDYLGGLCGYNNGVITNCYTAGLVTGGDDSRYLGGLCGYNQYGTITNCYATGSVNGILGSSGLGGLCGKNYGTITNCYATGSVTGDDYLGGLCGYNNRGTITNCYAAGSVTGGVGSEYLGGLCGYDYDGTITNCFWDVETSGIGIEGDDNYGATGKTTEQMQTQSTFTDANWDFSVVPLWHMPFQAIGYPMLGWQKDIPGDFTGRYGVDLADFAVLSNAWLSNDTPTTNWNEHCDLNGNGVIDPGDLRTFAEHWLCD